MQENILLNLLNQITIITYVYTRVEICFSLIDLELIDIVFINKFSIFTDNSIYNNLYYNENTLLYFKNIIIQQINKEGVIYLFNFILKLLIKFLSILIVKKLIIIYILTFFLEIFYPYFLKTQNTISYSFINAVTLDLYNWLDHSLLVTHIYRRVIKFRGGNYLDILDPVMMDNFLRPIHTFFMNLLVCKEINTSFFLIIVFLNILTIKFFINFFKKNIFLNYLYNKHLNFMTRTNLEYFIFIIKKYSKQFSKLFFISIFLWFVLVILILFLNNSIYISKPFLIKFLLQNSIDFSELYYSELMRLSGRIPFIKTNLLNFNLIRENELFMENELSIDYFMIDNLSLSDKETNYIKLMMLGLFPEPKFTLIPYFSYIYERYFPLALLVDVSIGYKATDVILLFKKTDPNIDFNFYRTLFNPFVFFEYVVVNMLNLRMPLYFINTSINLLSYGINTFSIFFNFLENPFRFSKLLLSDIYPKINKNTFLYLDYPFVPLDFISDINANNIPIGKFVPMVSIITFILTKIMFFFSLEKTYYLIFLEEFFLLINHLCITYPFELATELDDLLNPDLSPKYLYSFYIYFFLYTIFINFSIYFYTTNFPLFFIIQGLYNPEGDTQYSYLNDTDIHLWTIVQKDDIGLLIEESNELLLQKNKKKDLWELHINQLKNIKIQLKHLPLLKLPFRKHITVEEKKNIKLETFSKIISTNSFPEFIEDIESLNSSLILSSLPTNNQMRKFNYKVETKLLNSGYTIYEINRMRDSYSSFINLENEKKDIHKEGNNTFYKGEENFVVTLFCGEDDFIEDNNLSDEDLVIPPKIYDHFSSLTDYVPEDETHLLRKDNTTGFIYNIFLFNKLSSTQIKNDIFVCNLSYNMLSLKHCFNMNDLILIANLLNKPNLSEEEKEFILLFEKHYKISKHKELFFLWRPNFFFFKPGILLLKKSWNNLINFFYYRYYFNFIFFQIKPFSQYLIIKLNSLITFFLIKVQILLNYIINKIKNLFIVLKTFSIKKQFISIITFIILHIFNFIFSLVILCLKLLLIVLTIIIVFIICSICCSIIYSFIF